MTPTFSFVIQESDCDGTFCANMAPVQIPLPAVSARLSLRVGLWWSDEHVPGEQDGPRPPGAPGRITTASPETPRRRRCSAQCDLTHNAPLRSRNVCWPGGQWSTFLLTCGFFCCSVFLTLLHHVCVIGHNIFFEITAVLPMDTTTQQ